MKTHKETKKLSSVFRTYPEIKLVPRSNDKTNRHGFKAFINAIRLFFCHMGAKSKEHRVKAI